LKPLNQPMASNYGGSLIVMGGIGATNSIIQETPK